MRRPTLLCLAVLLASATCLPAADLAAIVSEDTALYVELSDPKGIWGDFEQSGLLDMVRAQPNGELQVRFVAGVVHQVALNALGIRLGEFAGKHAQRFALVLPDLPGAAEPAPCVLLDASTAKDQLARLLTQTIEPAIRARNPGITFADARHGDVRLRLLSPAQRQPAARAAQGQLPVDVAYAFVGDILAVGTQAGVKKLLDGRLLRPLAANDTFLAVRRKLAVPKGIVAYVNLRRLLADLRPQLDANPELARQLDDLGLTTVQWLAWATAFDGRGIRDRVYLHTGERKVGLLRLVSSLSQGASTAALVLPKQCPIVAALTFKDGPELWQAILRYLEEGGKVDHLARLDGNRQTVLLRMGINFDEDFVGALGGEIVLAANPDTATAHAAKRRMPPRGDLPYIIGLRIAKADAMKTTVHRFMASQPVIGGGVERTVATHRGIEVSSLTLPGRPMRPAYAFVGHYLLIARTGDIIRQCIDAQADPQQALAGLPRFKTFLKRMPARYNGMLFADLETLLVAATTRGAGVPAGAPPRPIVALASQLRGVYAAMTAESDGLTLETYTRPGLAGIIAATVAALSSPAPAAATPARPPKAGDF